MRLLILTHQFLPRHVGGTEWLAAWLAQQAQRVGHEVRVLTHVPGTANRADWGMRRTRHEGIEIVELHSQAAFAPNPARAEFDDPFTAWCMEALVEDFRPEAVVALHGMKLSGSVLQVLLEAGIPVVAVLTDFWFACPRHTLLRWDGTLCRGPRHALDCVRCVHQSHHFMDGLWQRLPEGEMSDLLKEQQVQGVLGPKTTAELAALAERPGFLLDLLARCHRVVALTEFARQLWLERGLQSERIVVLPHGPATFPQAGRRLDPLVPPMVLVVGPLSPAKGPQVLVEALRLIPEVAVQIHCYGPVPAGAFGDEMRAAAAADGRFQIKGEFAYDAFAELLDQATAFAAPARWYENGPLAVKSALAAGVPVLASNLGCFPEMIEHGRQGWLLPPGDATAWAQALRRVAAGEVPAAAQPQPSPETWSREILALFP